MTALRVHFLVDDGGTERDYAYCRHKYSATTAPTVGDDSSLGYSVGSKWHDTTNAKGYVCKDPSVGAAVWIQYYGAGTSVTDATYYTTAAHAGLSAEVVVPAYMQTLLDDTSASAARTTLELGTAAVENIGTSGATVPRLDGANTWGGVQTFANSVAAQGLVRLTGFITPSQITSDQNNYSPAGLTDASILRLSSDASRTVTGLTATAGSKFILVANVGSFNIVLSSENGSSTAANRFSFGSTITLLPGYGAVLWYDDTATRWRLVGAGVPRVNITGAVTGNGTGDVTVTLASGIVANSNLADMLEATIKGRLLGSVGPPQDLSYSQVLGILEIGSWSNSGLRVKDTDASHTLTLKPGSNLTADRVLTITTGDASRTMTLGGDPTLNGGTHSGTNTGDQTITLTGDVTGSGTGSFAATVVAASDTVAGKIELAVQSEMETGTDVVRAVTPGRQQFHASACKGWINFNGTGTIATRASYNVSGIVDYGAGVYGVTWNTDFSSANHAPVTDCGLGGNVYMSYLVNAASVAAGETQVATSRHDGVLVDCDVVTVHDFGDQ